MFNDMLAMSNNAGGGNPEWITSEISNNGKTISATWDYDAESIVILYKITGNNAKYIATYNREDSDLWYASSNDVFTHYGIDSTVTITKRSFTKTISSGTYSLALIMPISNKPNGYFT